MNTLSLKSLVFALFMLFTFASCGGEKEANNNSATGTADGVTGTLTLDKTSVKVNEALKVSFTVDKKLTGNPWIGIIPSEIEHGDEGKNDAHDVSYKYFDNQESGTLDFTAPTKAGKYDFRMHTTDSKGVEIVSISFEVTE
ncbi:hypothetical protein [Bernardetia sp.]|uniref:hypothetical protein n=1 Tax=Bernardetia sp. TaxID=1937974 RepID=UPI0025BD5EDA|nr:hypothetical protein [Bernardetia sp.]